MGRARGQGWWGIPITERAVGVGGGTGRDGGGKWEMGRVQGSGICEERKKEKGAELMGAELMRLENKRKRVLDGIDALERCLRLRASSFDVPTTPNPGNLLLVPRPLFVSSREFHHIHNFPLPSPNSSAMILISL